MKAIPMTNNGISLGNGTRGPIMWYQVSLVTQCPPPPPRDHGQHGLRWL